MTVVGCGKVPKIVNMINFNHKISDEYKTGVLIGIINMTVKNHERWSLTMNSFVKLAI